VTAPPKEYCIWIHTPETNAAFKVPMPSLAELKLDGCRALTIKTNRKVHLPLAEQP
jgi:hypothetical protein